MKEFTYPKVYLYRRIVQAKLFIDKHFADNIDLSDISREAFYSEYHFIRVFKKIYGMTPHRYLSSVRLNAAMRSLQMDRSVTEVCFEVGFDSLGSFTTLFTNRVGCNPSAYRRYWRERRAGIALAPLTFIPGCFAEAKSWKMAILEK